MAYELYYWPGIQGRGEFVRLTLEEAGVDYLDVARMGDEEAVSRITRWLEDEAVPRPPLAPPFLKDGETVIAQTAAILMYLGDRHGLAPKPEAERLWCHQIQLTIADLVAEAHDTHHPISVGLTYADQQAEAARRAMHFRKERIPKFLQWFEAILSRNPEGPDRLVGRALSTADLSLFQAVAGLSYAFPRATGRALERTPHVASLATRVAEGPRIRAYLASSRRIPFNDNDIFRHYPELDG